MIKRPTPEQKRALEEILGIPFDDVRLVDVETIELATAALAMQLKRLVKAWRMKVAKERKKP